jgi:hypothetical protein
VQDRATGLNRHYFGRYHWGLPQGGFSHSKPVHAHYGIDSQFLARLKAEAGVVKKPPPESEGKFRPKMQTEFELEGIGKNLE